MEVLASQKVNCKGQQMVSFCSYLILQAFNLT